MNKGAKHHTPDDCWLVIYDQDYEVTNLIARHSGGRDILQGYGTDASQLFETRPMGSGNPYSETARNLMDNYLISEIE